MLCGIVRLHDLAVEPAFDLQPLGGIGQFVGGDQPRAETAGAVEILAHRPLRGLALIFAHRAFVAAGVTGDAGGGVRGRQMLGALADDQDQLGLVVERFGNSRPDDRLAVRHQRGEPAHEDRRKFRNVVALRAFLDVLKIIQAEADDFPRPADRQRVGEPGKRLARGGRRALGDVGERFGVAVILA